MNTPIKAAFLTLIAMSLFDSTLGYANQNFTQSLSGGKPSLNMRLRYENIDYVNAGATYAKALTLRTRLGYETAQYAKTTAMIQFTHVGVVAGINQFSPEQSGYDVIQDPSGDYLNQAYLSYRPTDSLNMIGGRQRMIIDNARFIGNVGWHQNEQTFNALNIKYSQRKSSVLAAYMNDVYGITPAFDSSASNIILNAAYQTPWGKLTGYYYGLDNETASPNNDSSGVRLTGLQPVGNRNKIRYALEYTYQTADNSPKYDTRYSHAELGFIMDSFAVSAGFESLGSDGGNYAFQTPLATKHKFNGWADMFLTTPNDGLQDVYVSAGTKAAGVSLEVVYHTFGATQNSDSYGSEVDLAAIKSFKKSYTAGAKYSAYLADSDVANLTPTTANNDKHVAWIWIELAF